MSSTCWLGWRDYAILHLMAHYGLRPSEIVMLTLGGLDRLRERPDYPQRRYRIQIGSCSIQM
jgi:integrase/recombinase XerD